MTRTLAAFVRKIIVAQRSGHAATRNTTTLTRARCVKVFESAQTKSANEDDRTTNTMNRTTRVSGALDVLNDPTLYLPINAMTTPTTNGATRIPAKSKFTKPSPTYEPANECPVFSS